jgi:hypothetical protein
MNSKSENLELIFRKLKISDYYKFKKLFYSCFKKNISYKFYKWRYFSDKFSFCYGAFHSSKLIANVGMKSITLNNTKNDKIFSRHSSMVLKKYRGRRVFSKLLEIVKKDLIKNIKIVLMWPNKNNFANFGISKKRIIKKKYFLYKAFSRKKNSKKTFDYNIKKLNKFKNFIQKKDSFLFKNFDYFKRRYLSYNHTEYLINKFDLKKSSSFFILKKNKNKFGTNLVVLDHFGSDHIETNHLSQLINEERKVIFWSKKKIDRINYSLINQINLNIGFIKKTNLRKKDLILINKKFMLGDTDSFITIK